jgi:hypothetical protein
MLIYFRSKLIGTNQGMSSFFYKINPSEILRTKVDGENHEDLWDHWRGMKLRLCVNAG